MAAGERRLLRGALALVALIAPACGSSPQPPRADAAAPAASAAAPAEHEHKAPHGGALIELGDEYAHLELVVDRSSGAVTAYALDGEAEQPVRLTQTALEIRVTPPSGAPLTVQLKPVASELTGERPGDTSQFATIDPSVASLPMFTGTVVHVAVRGRDFADVAFSYPGGSEQ